MAWLIGHPQGRVQILKTELSLEPIRADFVSFLQVDEEILHIEFQTQPDPEMPLRMLDYFVRLYRRHRSPIRQIVIFLNPTTSPLVQVDYLALTETQHRYRVIRLWEEPAQALLPCPTLWPLAVLAKATEPETTLRQVAKELESLTNREERANLAAYVYLLGGLRFREDVLRQLLREEIMQESVTYQAVLEKGKQAGRIEGIQVGEQSLTLRQLQRKLGPIPDHVVSQVQSLSLEQLEQLAEALLEFESLADLVDWLR